jgi:glycyl-tRNA synthetase beta chain
MESQDLLIEIGTEELPPKALSKLSNAFSQGIVSGLKAANLNYGQVTSYATPRRLAVWIENVDCAEADRQVEKRGPALKAAFDNEGNPTKATAGFARSCGVDPADLEQMDTPKGVWLVYRSEQKGRTTSELVPNIVTTSLDALPIPKRMRWGDLSTEFVRPVHWLMVLLGSEIIPCEILSQQSGNTTRGHRFHAPEAIEISSGAEYASKLETKGQVIASFSRRRELIKAQVTQVATENGGTAIIDAALLDEVTGLVEWPVAIGGSFDERFLEVPAECLISAMKGHQKYFHLVDEAGNLLPKFITVSNISSTIPENIRSGNERVIRPRLTDAVFFWEQDLKQPLESHLDALSKVVFQKQLGTLRDKTDRVISLSVEIAEELGLDAEAVEDAALLAKCDLVTNMVGEFPDLQGIMGRYYAEKQGLSAEVSQALDEVYKPRNASDTLPESPVGQCLALAERLDTILAIFAIGQKPTGTKDPFALRRASVAVLRIMIEKQLNLDLEGLMIKGASYLEEQLSQNGASADVIANLESHKSIMIALDYIFERVIAYYRDKGIHPSVIDAVLAERPTYPLDLHQRIEAVSMFRQLPEAESLAAANKRISNILRKSDEVISDSINDALLTDSAEIKLAAEIEAMATEVEPLFAERNYTEGLKRLAGLRTSVDQFFVDVMVMVDDPALRQNRLALLKRLNNLFLRVADMSLLSPAS